MVDADGNELPVIPGVGPIKPWITLVHTIGLPWAIIGVYVWLVRPVALDSVQMQKDTVVEMKELKAQAQEAMPMLKEATKAIPLLQSIHKATKEGANQRHQDLDDLKAEGRQFPGATAPQSND